MSLLKKCSLCVDQHTATEKRKSTKCDCNGEAPMLLAGGGGVLGGAETKGNFQKELYMSCIPTEFQSHL